MGILGLGYPKPNPCDSVLAYEEGDVIFRNDISVEDCTDTAPCLAPVVSEWNLLHVVDSTNEPTRSGYVVGKS